MRWPRGRFNGQRIVGCEVKVRVNVTFWRLAWGNVTSGTCWCLGPISMWLGATYDHEPPAVR